MTKAILAALSAAAVLSLPASAATAAPPAKCKLISVETATQTRAVIDTSRSGDQTGTKSRTVTTSTSKCRGDRVTMTTYGEWSTPVFGY